MKTRSGRKNQGQPHADFASAVLTLTSRKSRKYKPCSFLTVEPPARCSKTDEQADCARIRMQHGRITYRSTEPSSFSGQK